MATPPVSVAKGPAPALAFFPATRPDLGAETAAVGAYPGIGAPNVVVEPVGGQQAGNE